MPTNGLVQDLLIRVYDGFAKGGSFNTAFGRASYQLAYEIYKLTIEASGVGHLRRFAAPGTTVIDVGANIGFFTLRFAEWVGIDGRVLAIEPHAETVAWLRRRLQKRKLEDRVQVVAAAAAEVAGLIKLSVNARHPGDHRIGDHGIAVAAVTIDQLTERTSLPPVSMVKIDVQGAEMRVLTGARRTLARFRPTLVIEVDDAALRNQGSSARALIDALAAQGYQPNSLTRYGVGGCPDIREELIAGRSRDYRDVVFLPLPAPAAKQ
jgi:FkbM family methyltransferase